MPVEFLNDKRQSVSKQTLPIRIGQKVVLYLQDDPDTKKQQDVGPNDTTVLKVEEKANGQKLPPGLRRFEVTALQDEDTVTLFACPDPVGLKVTDQVTFLVLNKSEARDYYRKKVLEIAMSYDGKAHYLWGAAGAMPDQQNGMPGRPGAVLSFHPAKHKLPNKNDIMHDVAVCQVSGFNTCAGRPLRLTPNGVYITNPLQQLTDEQWAQENDERSWRTVYKSYGTGRKGTILGERCEGVRHFDCVGFVNFCLSTALGESVHHAVSGEGKHLWAGYANVCPIVRADDDQPGDILIYNGTEQEVDVPDGKGGTYKKKCLTNSTHIAFSLGNGKGRINALETEFGVISETNVGKVTRRVRYPRLA
jgi:hypothetical protein